VGDVAKKKWLDDDEQHAWLGLLTTQARLDAALDRQLQRDFGLSHTQYGIMARLSVAPGRTMHMSTLAAWTASSQSRLSHAVARLEEQGWVERTRCSENKRAVHATLTETGWELIKKAAPSHVHEVRRLLFDNLTPQQVRALGEITDTVLATLEAEGFSVPVEPRD
jgi:DNA-binding MarR family transcriptional regulator